MPSCTTNAFIPASPSGLNYTTLRVQSTTDFGDPATDGVGAFRLTCQYSHMAFDDPIVFPNQAGKSHLHVFFGNTSTNYASTSETLATGGSTCAGGIANRSSYWTPAVVDSVTKQAQVPVYDGSIWYYKKGYNNIPASAIQDFPNGLRIITGKSPTATSSAYWPWIGHGLIRFACVSNGPYGETFPNCPPGDTFLIMLEFPNCWNGVDLDSPDHRAHMAYSVNEVSGTCPVSHPVPIPTLSLNIRYLVPAGGMANWKLSSDMYDGPGGYSMHADVWFMWDETTKLKWLNNCVRASKDCHGFLLGQGETVY